MISFEIVRMQFNAEINTNKTVYPGPHRHFTRNIKGLKIEVFGNSIHQSMRVTLPPQASDKTKEAYQQAIQAFNEYQNQPYDLLRHNCVTAVSTVLNAIDPKLKMDTSPLIGIPGEVELKLLNHYDDDPRDTIIGRFLKEYKKNRYSPFESHWQTDELTIENIIKHAHGETEGATRERSKSTLIKLGWVIEKKGRLLPTEIAPPNFASALNQYNTLPSNNMLVSPKSSKETFSDNLPKMEM